VVPAEEEEKEPAPKVNNVKKRATQIG